MRCFSALITPPPFDFLSLPPFSDLERRFDFFFAALRFNCFLAALPCFSFLVAASSFAFCPAWHQARTCRHGNQSFRAALLAGRTFCRRHQRVSKIPTRSNTLSPDFRRVCFFRPLSVFSRTFLAAPCLLTGSCRAWLPHHSWLSCLSCSVALLDVVLERRPVDSVQLALCQT